jgi:hypothetical protein
MKRYSVKLVRRLDQSAVVSVDAENASDAAHAGIKMTPLFWRTDITEDTYYESVKEIPEVELARAAQTVRTAGPVELNRIEPDPKGEEKNVTTKIYTYDVELDVSFDGDDLVSSCFISKTRDGTLYCSSLALLSDVGTIEGDNWGDVIEVPEKIITKIHHWAEENGY